jgi:ABC-type microcin C transport system permease subunit YejE
MTVEIDDAGDPAPPSGSPREMELEAKLNRRATWVGLFAFVAVAELLIMIEVLRQAS